MARQRTNTYDGECEVRHDDPAKMVNEGGDGKRDRRNFVGGFAVAHRLRPLPRQFPRHTEPKRRILSDRVFMEFF